ncbi:hypothetical protein [Streptococcus ovuberis]|uniref:Uncharacterized protein n=1 Tax=Streptococcus ovuberis TaxID=1936207 RepID=A0A7X6MXE4_9STRE|nr:hypothetical protein [Streptococcus ovuberis]NKZ19686.1 hypothetical protein [Streptococcus ovuberis]
MEALELTLHQYYYNYGPTDRPKLDQNAIRQSRREVIYQLEQDTILAQKQELDIAHSYQESIVLLKRMTDEEYQLLRNGLLQNVR